MLRLDKTAFRVVPLHYDEDAENRVRWQAMAFAEKREIVWHLQQRKRELHALCEVGREQARGNNAGRSANSERAD
ncbi:hypothetical protein ACFP2F_12975 [Hymenobacter artigasi]|uniref:Fe-S protein YdhL (DUF1289 family) n=1 Tax=Hymenobacter artigasi TaxID=2719616 RepID=A0ABX1HGJ8_9BACT|nr:hypothetical protein [Hymenobacter artigasi]NKI88166.1 putative Fe-S protein YdhL (DUF1289 family) [Hymenobacter artigasi]